MATRFDFESVYDEDNWGVLYPNSQGYQEKFLEMCKAELAQSDFPNVDIEIEEFKSGGMFFNVEKTRMLAVSFKKSQFKQLAIYFRAQQFGNMVYYSLLNSVEKGFWDAVQNRGTEEILNNIRHKCKNWAQWEEFQSLNLLGDLVFRKVLSSMDPAWKDNKQLFEMRSK